MNTTPTLKIEHNNSLDSQVELLNFDGVLDSYTIKENRKLVMEYATNLAKPYLLLDFSKLDYINSESIGMLFEINEMLDKKAKKLIIVGANSKVMDVLEVIGLVKVVPFYKNLIEFLDSKK